MTARNDTRSGVRPDGASAEAAGAPDPPPRAPNTVAFSVISGQVSALAFGAIDAEDCDRIILRAHLPRLEDLARAPPGRDAALVSPARILDAVLADRRPGSDPRLSRAPVQRFPAAGIFRSYGVSQLPPDRQ